MVKRVRDQDDDLYLNSNNLIPKMTYNQRVAYHVDKIPLEYAERVTNIFQGEAIRSAIDAHREEDIDNILQMDIDRARDYANAVSIEIGCQASSENSNSNYTEIANENYMTPPRIFIWADDYS